MNWFQRKIAMWLTNNLFNVVTAEDVYKVLENGEMEVNGKLVEIEEADQYRGDASHIKRSRIHKEVKKVLKLKANNMMYQKGSAIDLLFGRALLYFIRQYDIILDEIANKK